MSPAEALFAQGFFQRLAAFCQPPKPEPDHAADAEPDGARVSDEA